MRYLIVLIGLMSFHLSTHPYCGTEDSGSLYGDHGLIASELPSHELNIWSEQERFNLTYCVSGRFGKYHEMAVKAAKEAAEAWMGSANVKFIYVGDENQRCLDDYDYTFHIETVSRRVRYEMKAFFPDAPKEKRRILVSEKVFNSAYAKFRGVMTHEFGHVLGFRHEQAHPDNVKCHEEGPIRPMTDYDRKSIMHYKTCGGTSLMFFLSELDREGAAKVYP